jgi:hypothetical protein
MNNNKITPFPQMPDFPNISRYTRWMNQMEEKERQMSSKKRKHKWLIILTGLFLLFVSSFFLFPGPGISHQPLTPLSETGGPSADTLKKRMSLTFDMPVDSFEQKLKKQLHEKLSK